MIEFNRDAALAGVDKVDMAYSTLEEVGNKITSVINSDNFFGDADTSSLAKLKELNNELQNFMFNSVLIYNEFLESVGGMVSPLENGSDLFLNNLIMQNGGVYVSQIDSKWKELGLEYGGKLINVNGCGPTSITNEIALAFGVSDEETIQKLYEDIVSLMDDKGCFNKDVATAHDVINSYLTDPDKRNEKYSTLNSVISTNNMDIVSTGVGATNLLTAIKNAQATDGTIFVGKMNFNDANNKDSISCEKIYGLINGLEQNGDNLNLTFGHVSVGTASTERPFSTGNGHYVGVTLNVNEFKNDGTLYIVDSYPRNIAGEDYLVYDGTRIGTNSEGINYNFSDSFMETFDVTHVSDTVVKVTLKDGQTWDAKTLAKLGLSGSSSVIVTEPTDQAVMHDSLKPSTIVNDFENSISGIIPEDTSNKIVPESSLTQNSSGNNFIHITSDGDIKQSSTSNYYKIPESSLTQNADGSGNNFIHINNISGIKENNSDNGMTFTVEEDYSEKGFLKDSSELNQTTVGQNSTDKQMTFTVEEDHSEKGFLKDSGKELSLDVEEDYSQKGFNVSGQTAKPNVQSKIDDNVGNDFNEEVSLDSNILSQLKDPKEMSNTNITNNVGRDFDEEVSFDSNIWSQLEEGAAQTEDVIISPPISESFVSQADPQWQELNYGGNSLLNSGSGPSSIANEVIMSFDIEDKATAEAVYGDIVKLLNDKGCYNKDVATAHDVINEYLTNPEYRSDEYSSLNGVINSYDGDIKYTGNGYQNMLDAVLSDSAENLSGSKYVGKMNFNDANTQENDRTYDRIYTMNEELYNSGKDVDVTFGHVNVGRESHDRAFATGEGGHYVSVNYNVKELMEDGTLYIVDSAPKNIAGEDYMVSDGIRKDAGTYNFSDSFNEKFDVVHLSDTMMKVTLKEGQKWSPDTLAELGLSGSGSIIVTDK